MNIKPSFNEKRVHLGEYLPLDTPFAVIIDPSERCNFRCSYCFRSKQKGDNWGFAAKESLMDWDTFVLAVEQIKEFPKKIKLISITGNGEPMCNPELARMAEYVHKQGITEQLDMHTNASLLTKQNTYAIAQAGFTKIVVSLQGLNEKTYERVCGYKIDFARLYSSLKYLYLHKNEGTKLHIKIEDVALDSQDPKQKQQFFDTFGNIADSVSIETAVPIWCDTKAVVSKNTNKYGNSFGDIDYCPLAFYKIQIGPDGEIYPCTRLPEPMSLGNIHMMSLRGAWNGEKRRNFLRNHLRLTRHKCPGCEGCYIPINTVTSEVDIIDSYRDEILSHLDN